jgi:phosphoribosylanthranilate isomerase
MTAPAEIQDLLFRVPASTLQLHGSIALESVAALRSRNPHLKFVRAIPVTGRESIAVALRWHSCVDALLLDTQGHGDQGGTGRIHDWNLSREIIQTVTGPVILAGGLSPENVEEAVRATGPFAVDANSGVTNELLLKDPRKVAEFIRRALKGA